MSFSWNAERVEKEYEVKGTVTISTEEYRDLINEAAELRVKGQAEHDDWYKEYRRADELKSSLEKAEAKLKEINAWFDDENEMRLAFREWKLNKEESDGEQ